MGSSLSDFKLPSIGSEANLLNSLASGGWWIIAEWACLPGQRTRPPAWFSVIGNSAVMDRAAHCSLAFTSLQFLWSCNSSIFYSYTIGALRKVLNPLRLVECWRYLVSCCSLLSPWKLSVGKFVWWQMQRTREMWGQGSVGWAGLGWAGDRDSCCCWHQSLDLTQQILLPHSHPQLLIRTHLTESRRCPEISPSLFDLWSAAGRRAGSLVWPIWTMIIKQTAPRVSSLGLIRNSWASHSNSLNFPRSINFWLIGFKLCRAKHVGQARPHSTQGLGHCCRQESRKNVPCSSRI